MPKGIKKYRMTSLPGVVFNTEGEGGGGAPASNEGEAPATGDEPLGEGGKKALEAEREARRKADETAKTATQQLTELQAELAKLKQAGETDTQKVQRETQEALQKARDEAAAQARSEVTRERVLDKIEVAAAGKFADIEDAQLHLAQRADEFVKDGSIDTAAIAEAVKDLLAKKPHLAAETKTPVPSPGRAGIGTGSGGGDDASVTPGLGRLQHAYAQSPNTK